MYLPEGVLFREIPHLSRSVLAVAGLGYFLFSWSHIMYAVARGSPLHVFGGKMRHLPPRAGLPSFLLSLVAYMCISRILVILVNLPCVSQSGTYPPGEGGPPYFLH